MTTNRIADTREVQTPERDHFGQASPFPSPVYVDTHAHLDEDAFAVDRDNVLADASAVGVARVVNIGYRPSRWPSTIALASDAPSVAFALGLHPHHADEFTNDLCDQLRQLLETSGARALGEIGLDLARDGPSLLRQKEAFTSQLELARELRMPIVIHQRAAERDLMDCLDGFHYEHPVVLHSFDGSRDLARFGLERGYWFGVGGLMTRAGSAALRSILATIPLSRILLETDSPYLVPAGIKDRRNTPANIPTIAARLGDLLSVPLASIAAQTTANAESCFALGATVIAASADGPSHAA